jgi:competence ComEA-like helix-hairpin-helix protein
MLLWALGFGLYRWSDNRVNYPSWAVDSMTIHLYDSLMQRWNRRPPRPIYPFNPNYLTDYRAYVLGIDTAALRRIRRYRAGGGYFRSAEDFQRVARLPDSLFRRLKSYIHIPPPTPARYYANRTFSTASGRHYESTRFKLPTVKSDINTATAEDLRHVYGIGAVLSRRIVRYREKLGGFTIPEQLKDVYGLPDSTYRRLWQWFKIQTPRRVRRIPLNEADIYELTQNPYIDFNLAENIVEYRTLHGAFHRLKDLEKVPGFPADKYHRIILYLRL